MKETMNVIHDINAFQEAMQQPMSVFVFSANWCPDCGFIEPFMPSLVEQYHDYEFYYVDRDECLDICQEFGVLGIPSFVAFARGVEVNRFVSRFRKTKEEVSEFLSSLRNGKDE